jgi:hypothetical protein
MKSKDIKIALDPKHVGRLRSLGLNWACTAQRPFKFRPTSFTASIDGLKPKSINQARQIEVIDRWVDDPTVPGLYGISSAPNDGQSKLLAAWMMERHLLYAANNKPIWHDLTGGFESSLMEPEQINATMLVLNNVGPDVSSTKKDKLRDILERYSDLPIVVVVNGSDAFTFFTRDLRKSTQGVIYLANSLVKRAHEI